MTRTTKETFIIYEEPLLKKIKELINEENMLLRIGSSDWRMQCYSRWRRIIS